MKIGTSACVSLVVLVGLTVALCASSFPTVQGAADTALAAALGAGCQTDQFDTAFCVYGDYCYTNPSGGGYKQRHFTGAVKRWCASAESSGVCDCNQTGVAQTSCVEEAVCTGKTDGTTCTGCGDFSPLTTVQTTVNLNGATCKSDADCA